MPDPTRRARVEAVRESMTIQFTAEETATIQQIAALRVGNGDSPDRAYRAAVGAVLTTYRDPSAVTFDDPTGFGMTVTLIRSEGAFRLTVQDEHFQHALSP